MSRHPSSVESDFWKHFSISTALYAFDKKFLKKSVAFYLFATGLTFMLQHEKIDKVQKKTRINNLLLHAAHEQFRHVTYNHKTSIKT